MDTLANLKAFVAAADAGSFSAAARKLDLVPSVISKRIDQLEWRIRAPLFARSTRKLTLTDVGDRYLPTVRELVRQMDDALDGMARSSGDLEGHIRVKVPTTMAILYLSDILYSFLRSQPKISMDIVLADRSVNPLEEGFDLALGARPELYGGVQDIALCRLKRYLCASPAYLARRGTPQHVSELPDHDCVVFATTGPRWEFMSQQGLIGIDVRPKLRSNDGAAICNAAIAGSGIAVLTDYMAGPAIRSGQLVEILPEFEVPDIWLKALVPGTRIALPRVRMLLDWLKQHLEQLPPLDKATVQT
ncbi:MAG: LysR family transcriptional regulator [Polaromonas sp.]|uniref:LysR family transcriptional regulator n=1 Tax=Polaromonas sp. TaxID=1869339 RepID=UPI0025E8485F|nr:LysR family transcriptional regulator [Polaromonas sp.]MBI2728429.1 LysR family transcriptional regulator [Polaromonas sp.]